MAIFHFQVVILVKNHKKNLNQIFEFIVEDDGNQINNVKQRGDQNVQNSQNYSTILEPDDNTEQEISNGDDGKNDAKQSAKSKIAAFLFHNALLFINFINPTIDFRKSQKSAV
jgi:hypothetical protein